AITGAIRVQFGLRDRYLRVLPCSLPRPSLVWPSSSTACTPWHITLFALFVSWLVWFLFLVLGPWVFEPHQQASQLGLCISVWAKSRGNCCLHPTAEYTVIIRQFVSLAPAAFSSHSRPIPLLSSTSLSGGLTYAARLLRSPPV
ncbi:hypothetical protein FB45DRAFT_1061908, partial [Roridomyces roridus]